MGFEKAVITKLKTVDLVKEIIGVMGTYDILVKLESENSDDFKSIITLKIRQIPNIRTTLTLMVVDSQECGLDSMK